MECYRNFTLSYIPSFFVYFILIQDLVKLLNFLGYTQSCDPLASAFQKAGIPGVPVAQIGALFFREGGDLLDVQVPRSDPTSELALQRLLMGEPMQASCVDSLLHICDLALRSEV